MDSVWVIQGATGEYSDHREWFVGFFTKKENAQAYVEFLSERMRQLGVGGEAVNGDYEVRGRGKEAMQLIDPGFQCDYTGSSYTAIEVKHLTGSFLSHP